MGPIWQRHREGEAVCGAWLERRVVRVGKGKAGRTRPPRERWARLGRIGPCRWCSWAGAKPGLAGHAELGWLAGLGVRGELASGINLNGHFQINSHTSSFKKKINPT